MPVPTPPDEGEDRPSDTSGDEQTALRVAPIASVLAEHDVRYVVMGSYGAIVQGVDLELTDLDVVPELTEANLAKLSEALVELEVVERSNPKESDELRSELVEDPSRITGARFWNFSTRYGGLDLVLRPSGFPRGYADLEPRAKVVHIVDATDADCEADVVVGDVEDIYTSKPIADRPKDREALSKFVGVHRSPKDRKEALRRRHREGRH